jgi:hyperosmotically inducible periplasmic protein
VSHPTCPWLVGLIATRRKPQPKTSGKQPMNTRNILSAAAAALVLVTASGCAVTRGQESTGAYIDDSAITTSVKARFVDSASVDASAISVETMKGTVMLSGFAKNANEKSTAESIAMKVPGVVAVKNVIAVRP